MLRPIAFAAALIAAASLAAADTVGDEVAALYAKIKPALVTVRLVLESETGQRGEATLFGIVADKDGLVFMPSSDSLATVPKSYFKTVEILRPDKVDEPIPAKYVEYDRVGEVAFVQATAKADELTPLDLAAGPAPKIGQEVVVFSLMGQEYGYALQFHLARIGGTVSKPTTRYLVTPTPGTSTGMVCALDGKLIGRLLMDTVTRNVAVQGRTMQIRASTPLIQPAEEVIASIQRVASGALAQESWIGVMGMQALDKDVAEALGLGDAVAIRIGSVVEGGPAEAAGLKAGDVILAIAGEALAKGATDHDTLMSFANQVRDHKVGDKIELKVNRADGGKTETVTVTVGVAPTSAADAKRWTAAKIGATFRELVFEDRYRLKLDRAATGAVVAVVAPSEAAATAGLQPGDVVLELDQQPVKDLAALQKLIEDTLKKNPTQIVLAVQRGVSDRTVVMIELNK